MSKQKKTIADFRSDTVTLPTDAMRQAMAEAEVGDDVYGDDPTVNRLERLAAEMLGKPAGLFVPSGVFANQVAIMTHTHPGNEVLVGEEAHIVQHEAGSPGRLSGVNLRPVATDLGTFSLTELEKRIRTVNIHFPVTGLICVENAHSSGAVVELEAMQEVKHLADCRGVPVHFDGARFFNAVTKLKCSAEALAATADSVSICLSKGLCAPVGSLLVGQQDFIDRARQNRKIMGGGMRQVGILAAAGLIALQEMTTRLVEDHRQADYLAERLTEIENLTILKRQRDINMVFFELPSEVIAEEKLVKGLLDEGIKINGQENGQYRLVTHYGINRQKIDQLMLAIKKIIIK